MKYNSVRILDKSAMPLDSYPFEYLRKDPYRKAAGTTEAYDFNGEKVPDGFLNGCVKT